MSVFDPDGSHQKLMMTRPQGSSPLLQELTELVRASAGAVPAVLWDRMRRLPHACIEIEPVGVPWPTAANLAFQGGHAQAGDAICTALDAISLIAQLQSLGLETVRLHSRASDRQEYLQRPHLGRRLDEASGTALAGLPGVCDIVFVIASGLSATAS